MGLGTAPIGHVVQVTAPEVFDLDIELEVILGNTAYLPTVEQSITENLENYIKLIQDQWDDGEGEYELIVYYNQVVSYAITAPGVLNVASCKLNGDTKDINIPQSKQLQYMPKLTSLKVSKV